MKTNQRILTGVVVLLFLLCLISVLPVHGEAKIYDTVVRLHVLANSDSEQDQALKLQVRDEVLRVTGPLLEGCEGREQAVEILNRHLGDIEQAAQAAVLAHGYEYPVSVLLGEEEYPTRNYESCCFPAGTYLSLRVCIGEARGQNWWCVLFPPLCLSLAADRKTPEDGAIPVSVDETADGAAADEQLLAAGFTPYEISLISGEGSPKTVVKFRIVELLKRLFAK